MSRSVPAPFAGALVFPWNLPTLAGDGTPQDAVTVRLVSGLYVMTASAHLVSSASDLASGEINAPDGTGSWTVIAGGLDLLPLLGSTDTNVLYGANAVIEVEGGEVPFTALATTVNPSDTISCVGAFTFTPAVDRP